MIPRPLLYIAPLLVALAAGWMARGWYEDSKALDLSDAAKKDAAEVAKDVTQIDTETLTEDRQRTAEVQAREEEIRNEFSEKRKGRGADEDRDRGGLVDPFDSDYYRVLRENRADATRAPGDVHPRE